MFRHCISLQEGAWYRNVGSPGEKGHSNSKRRSASDSNVDEGRVRECEKMTPKLEASELRSSSAISETSRRLGSLGLS